MPERSEIPQQYMRTAEQILSETSIQLNRRLEQYHAHVQVISMYFAKLRADILSVACPMIILVPGESVRVYYSPEVISQLDELDEMFIDYLDSLDVLRA